MTINTLLQRQQRYFHLSSQIALLDNTQLLALFETPDTESSWGINQQISIDDATIFVKRIPLTQIEYERMFSTKNVYELPTFYQYGFGSAGFGSFRELAVQIKTSNWVLAGEIETFPLLYHYRVIPSARQKTEVDMAYHERFVAYWGSNENIGRHTLDRANPPYELVLFLEHFPYTVGKWLLEHPNKTPMVMADMHATINFLQNHGINHLDVHFFNMLTDEKRVYLTDFGLAQDKQFELTPEERQFYDQHTEYDYGHLLWGLGYQMHVMYKALSDEAQQCILEKYGLLEGAGFEELMVVFLNNIEELVITGLMTFERNYIEQILKYHHVITFMHDFYVAMRSNPQKDSFFDQVKLKQLLMTCGFTGEHIS